MYDSEPVDPWLAWIFLDEDCDCVAPSRNGNAALNRNIHEFYQALEKNRLLDYRLVMAKVPAGRRGRR